jgi:regulatory protein
VPDAYTVALTLLSARELSESQLRARLARRNIPADAIDTTLARLKADGTLDDRRVAGAIARMESGIRHRGRARVLQKIRQAGIASDVAHAAVREVFEDVDEDELLTRALERRLRGRVAIDLDDRARARLVRALQAQGFSLTSILKALQ